MVLSREQRSFIFKTGFFTATFVIAVVLLWSLKALILPTILGALLAYIFKPLLNTFKYHWLPESIRITFLTCTFLGFLLSATWLVRENIPTEKEQLEILTRVQYKLNQKVDDFLELKKEEKERSFFTKVIAQEVMPLVEDVQNYLKLNDAQKEKFIEFYKKDLVSETYYQYFLENIQHQLIVEKPREPATAQLTVSKPFSLTRVADVFSIWIVMPLVFLFLLFDKGEIRRYFMSFVSNKYLELTQTVIVEVDLAIGRYLRGTLLESFLVAVTMFIGFFLIGMPFQAALLISIFSGFTNAIPYLGPAVGLIVATAYALIAENIEPLVPFLTADHLLIGIFVTVGFTQFMDNFVYQPVILAQAVNLHALVVVFALIGGSTLFGFAGILLAIPAVVVVKVSVETLFRGLRDYKII